MESAGEAVALTWDFQISQELRGLDASLGEPQLEALRAADLEGGRGCESGAGERDCQLNLHPLKGIGK